MQHLRRRTLLAAGAVVAIAPSLLRAQGAQKSAVPRIGFLSRDKSVRIPDFRVGLEELGYIEGKTIHVEYRTADGRSDRLAQMAQELVNLKVRLIVTAATPATRAALDATKTIPIVFLGVGDPITSGFVKSLSRPGGNATGLSNVSPELIGKRFDLIAGVVPKLSRVGALLNPDNPTRAVNLRGLREAAEKRGVAVVALDAARPDDMGRAFAVAVRERVNAVVAQADQSYTHHAAHIVRVAAEHQMPACYPTLVFVEAGGLMSYSFNSAEQSRRTAHYVDRILKGASPAELPVEEPTKFELGVNLKAAKALRLAIPNEILLRADKVIE